MDDWKDYLFGSLIVVAIAVLVGAWTYSGHLGSVREDALRGQCISAKGRWVASEGADFCDFGSP